jgi:hypothetical protein
VTRTTPRKVTATTARRSRRRRRSCSTSTWRRTTTREAYLDGVLILTSPGFGITRHIEGGIQITTGDHVLAFKVTNFFDDGSPGGNPSMLIYTACSLTVDGLIGEVITFSGSLTLINEYPAAAPGLPICAALKTFVDEAQAATPPRLVGVTYDFDELNDSNVAAMDPISDLAARVGDDGVTFSRQLIDSGYGHIRMTPGLVLQVYKPGTLGEVTDATEVSDDRSPQTSRARDLGAGEVARHLHRIRIDGRTSQSVGSCGWTRPPPPSPARRSARPSSTHAPHR